MRPKNVTNTQPRKVSFQQKEEMPSSGEQSQELEIERERESDTAGTSIERNHVEPRAGDEGKEEISASACTQLHMANFIAQAQAER